MLFHHLLPCQRLISISTTSFAVLSKTEFGLSSSAFLLENHRTGLLLGRKAEGRSLRDGSRDSNQELQTLPLQKDPRWLVWKLGAAALIEVITHTDAVETLTALGEYALACKHRTNHCRTTPHTLIPSESGDLSTCLEQLIFYFLGSWKAEHSFGRPCVERALEDENAASVHLP